MPRPTSRARLENGIKLDLNRLKRRGFIKPGASAGPTGIEWNSSHWGQVETGTISADLSDHHGWLKIRTTTADQHIQLRAVPRHFGGVQWYFICPTTGRQASVLWRPPGARRFSSRQTWGRQVAYSSQCVGKTDQAWRMKTKIKMRLIADLDPDEWDFPPKPKWMRWRTYRRYEAWFDRWEDRLDDEICIAAARLLRVW